MIKEIKTEKFEGLAVLVPDDAKNIGFHKSDWDMQVGDFSNVYYDINNESFEIDIVDEDHDYEIISKATELTEDQRIQIVDSKINYTVKLYINYIQNQKGISVYEYKNSQDSFKSLLQSAGCDLKQNWLILKKLIN